MQTAGASVDPDPNAAPAPARGRVRRWLWRLAATGVLALVFLAYAQPSLMQHLADQVWGCF